MKSKKLNITVLVQFLISGTVQDFPVKLQVPAGTDLNRVHKSHRAAVFGQVQQVYPTAKHLTPIRVKHGALTKWSRTWANHAKLNAQ